MKKEHNIIFVASLFGKKACSASIRNISLVKGLAELGYRIEVYTIAYPEVVMDNLLSLEGFENVTIHRARVPLLSDLVPSTKPVPVNKSFISKVVNVIKSLYFLPGIDKHWLREVPNLCLGTSDILISSSDTKTAHFFAKRINDVSQCQWIQIWGDPWHDDVTLELTAHKIYAKRNEIRILNSASKILYVSPITAETSMSKFPSLAHKIGHLPRGYFRSIVSKRNANCEKVFILTYTGVLNRRNIKEVLSAIDSFNEKSDLKIRLDVYGRVNTEDINLLNTSKYANYMGIVDIKTVYKAYENSDALLFLGNSAGSSQIPGKLYDYYGTNLPILAVLEESSVNTSLVEFLSKSKRCIISNNPKLSDFQQLLNLRKFDGPLVDYSSKYVAQKLVNDHLFLGVD